MFLGQPLSGLGSWGGPSGAWRFPIVIPVNFALQVAGQLQPTTFVVTQNFCQIANAGIQIIVEVQDQDLNALNLLGASSIMLAFQQPDGTQFNRAATFLTNGLDGTIYYVTTATDILEAGLWYVQAQVTIGGAMLTTMWGQFEANANL